MKKLLIVPLLILLTSCVTYYQPETALEDGVYYAEDDPQYVVYQDWHPDAAYYPWSSLDYFYMGYNPYPIYPYYTGFPFGLTYAYLPWGYWGRYHGYCRHDLVCGGGYHDQRYAGNESGNRQTNNDETSNDETSHDKYTDSDLNSLGSTASGAVIPYSTYVSTMPAGYGVNRGMVIRSGETTKVGNSKIQPVQSDVYSNGIIVVAVPPSSATTPVAASRSGQVGSRAISERPAQTLAGGSSYSSGSSNVSNVSNSSGPSRSSNSSGPSRSSATTSRSRAPSGNSNRSRSGARSSNSRSSKGSRSIPREKRD